MVLQLWFQAFIYINYNTTHVPKQVTLSNELALDQAKLGYLLTLI